MAIHRGIALLNPFRALTCKSWEFDLFTALDPEYPEAPRLPCVRL